MIRIPGPSNWLPARLDRFSEPGHLAEVDGFSGLPRAGRFQAARQGRGLSPQLRCASVKPTVALTGDRRAITHLDRKEALLV